MFTLRGELVVLSGPYKGRRVPISREKIRIGRDSECDVALDDEAASRHHAEIEFKDNKLLVRDMGSTNGTYVNDAKVNGDIPLTNGDRLGVGDTVFLLQLPNDPKPRSSLNLVFGDDRKGITTRLTLKLDDTQFLEMKEGTAIAEATRYFTALHEFNVAVAGVLHKPAMFERMMDRLFKTFEPDRVVILLLTPEGEPGQKIVRQREGLSDGAEISISRTMAQQVLHKQESFLSVDAGADERLAASESMHRMRVQSVMGVPLKLKDRMLGMLYLDRVSGGAAFAEMDLKLCSAMALQAAVCIENVNLYNELLDAAEFNNAVLRALSSGLVVINTDGRVLRINQAALKILRLEETAILGKTLEAIPDLAEINQILRKAVETGQPEDRYEVRIRMGGVTVPLGISASLLTDHAGKTVGAVGHFRDLAQIRKLEAQVQRSQHLASLGQMAAGVAHEIRNPLNSIRGFTQLIQEGLAEEKPDLAKFNEFPKIVIEEVDRMNRIVQDLLDFSRQRELTLSPMQIETLISELAREIEPEFKSAKVKLKIEAPVQPLPGVLGNGDKLRQVLRNLLQNALQASQEGQEVRIGAEAVEGVFLRRQEDGSPEEARRREVAIVVSDQGVGIQQEALAKIFDPFFTTKDFGTGLGLSICQKIVDQHGGRIEVKSEPKKGATFTISLPAV